MAQIGIILATYNGEKYLREQLESILSNRIRDSSVVVSFAIISFDFPAIFVIKSTDYIG